MGNILSAFSENKHPDVFSEQYKVGVVSGSHQHTGLDGEITVVLIGKQGRSEPKVLKKATHGDHKGPHVEVFWLNTNEDLEELGAIEVYNGGRGVGATWELVKVVVDKTMEGGLKHDTYWERWIFPCYSWVNGGHSRIFFAGMPACSPARCPWWLLKQRELALARNKQVYQWSHFDGMPSGMKALKMDDLPREEQLPLWHERDFKVAAANQVIRKGLSGLLGDYTEWMNLGEHVSLDSAGALVNELYAHENVAGELDADASRGADRLPKPEVIKTHGTCFWQSDAQFARQFTPHCSMLKVCRRVPPELVYGLSLESVRFREGHTFASEAAAGRVYCLDYSFLKPFLPDPKSGTTMAAPECYFYMIADPQHIYSTGDSCLLPIAIRLDPSDLSAPVFTPDDETWDWMTAKAFVANADAQYHMAVSYYLKTLAVSEPFAVSMQRNLSVMHPLYKLLRPYTKYCLAFNAMARESLISSGGLLEHLFSIHDQAPALVAQEYTTWRFEDFGFPMVLVQNGFNGSEYFPDYPNREDGLLVWAAIVDYVKDYVNLYYSSDSDVEKDTELQMFYQEAMTVGHAKLFPKDAPPLEEIESRNVLAKVLVYLIWNFSGQSSSFTRSCYETYAFPPNRATTLHGPIPFKKGDCTANTFKDMLPNKHRTALAVCLMNWMSERTTLAGTMLGAPMEEFLMDPDALECYDRFQGSLRTVERVITARNEKRHHHHHWMSPTIISNSLVR